jgi:hypothetical protein
MTVHRLRVYTDVLYKTRNDKPLSSPEIVLVAQRCRTYAWTAAWEGFDHKAEVIFDDDEKNNTHAHHHDARYERCRPDYAASRDDLGPIE